MGRRTSNEHGKLHRSQKGFSTALKVSDACCRFLLLMGRVNCTAVQDAQRAGNKRQAAANAPYQRQSRCEKRRVAAL